MPVEPGTVIAKRYGIIRQLGKGGMGEVYAAENTRTGRRVALKVLRAESKEKQSAIERFRREARAAGSINSDYVTQVLDVEDDPDHGIVLVFELLEGESLVERLKRTGPISYDEVWGIVEAVWMGLADAHQSGIIHRDLKPSNVFLERRRNGQRVKILDFGISKLPKAISSESLTQVGQSLGTFSFMPPEQIGKAKTVDHRADIYAATTLVFQAMSGKLPYQAKNVVRMMELKSKSEPRPLGEVMKEPIDPRLEAFIARGLARDPEARFQSADEALVEWRKLRPPGAASMADLDSSGVYPPEEEVEDEESDDVKTQVMRDRSVLEQAKAEAARVRAQRQGAHDAGSTATDPPRPAQAPAPRAAEASAPPARIHGVGATPTPAPGEPSGQAEPLPAPTPASDAPVDTTLTDPVLHGQSTSPSELPSPPELSSPSAPPPAKQPGGLRTLVALVLGALGLVLVGFVTVAVVLHLIH